MLVVPGIAVANHIEIDVRITKMDDAEDLWGFFCPAKSAGRATTVGNTTYYYNANGSSAGSSTRMGNTTYFYNANGSSAGTATTMGR